MYVAGFEKKFPRFTKIQPKRYPVVAKKIFYDEKWLFSKGSTWHRSPWQEMGGNWSKMGF